MESNSPDSFKSSKLKKKINRIFLLGIGVTGLLLFIPAGTLKYVQAWIFITTLFIPAFFVTRHFIKKDPAFLQKRIQFKEKEKVQKKIINLSTALFIAAFLIPGFDFRYGWSNIPLEIVFLADALMLLGYGWVFRVFKENRYASRIIEVEKGQKVITTGPYAIIRHPMYVGVLIMYLCMPIVLGSYWAFLCILPILPIIIARTVNEERALSKNLKGYKEYMTKVKYRLIPGIW